MEFVLTLIAGIALLWWLLDGGSGRCGGGGDGDDHRLDCGAGTQGSMD